VIFTRSPCAFFVNSVIVLMPLESGFECTMTGLNSACVIEVSRRRACERIVSVCVFVCCVCVCCVRNVCRSVCGRHLLCCCSLSFYPTIKAHTLCSGSNRLMTRAQVFLIIEAHREADDRRAMCEAARRAAGGGTRTRVGCRRE
jgi:hypothetical protein